MTSLCQQHSAHTHTHTDTLRTLVQHTHTQHECVSEHTADSSFCSIGPDPNPVHVHKHRRVEGPRQHKPPTLRLTLRFWTTISLSPGRRTGEQRNQKSDYSDPTTETNQRSLRSQLLHIHSNKAFKQRNTEESFKVCVVK